MARDARRAALRDSVRVPRVAIKGTCLCGKVQVGVAQRPRQVTQCNCSVCRRYGTLWAYYRRGSVSITAPRSGIEEYTVRSGGLRFGRCRSCGCVIYWNGAGKSRDQRMGVNTRLLDNELMASVPVMLLDGDKTWHRLGKYVRPEMWISPSRKPARPPK